MALAVAQRVETFPVGIAGNVFFLVLFVDVVLSGDHESRLERAVQAVDARGLRP